MPEIDPCTKLPRYTAAAVQARDWPAAVPVLSAADVLPYGDPPTPHRRPLWVWLNDSIPDDDADEEPTLRDIFLNELWRVQIEELGLRQSLSLAHFSRAHTPAQVADLWNRVLVRLGYTIEE